MMKREDVIDAMVEANRFIKSAKVLLAALDDKEKGRWLEIIGGPETSAVRRASMDLTRALAVMRRR